MQRHYPLILEVVTELEGQEGTHPKTDNLFYKLFGVRIELFKTRLFSNYPK